MHSDGEAGRLVEGACHDGHATTAAGRPEHVGAAELTEAAAGGVGGIEPPEATVLQQDEGVAAYGRRSDIMAARAPAHLAMAGDDGPQRPAQFVAHRAAE